MIPSGVTSSTVALCTVILELLLESRYNKKECRGLHKVLSSLKRYLEQLNCCTLSAPGFQALEHLRDALFSAEKLVVRMASTGPLRSLLLASDFRQHLRCVTTDLMNSLAVLGVGEQLVRGKTINSEVQSQLQTVGSNLFKEQEATHAKLLETTAVASMKQSSPHKVQQLLLEQLKGSGQVAGLGPQELLSELQALQLAALYGSGESGSVTVEEGMVEGKRKTLGSETEEFLVQQLCAALSKDLQEQGQKPAAAAAAAVAAHRAPSPLPAGCLCPIGLTPMIDPVILVETGQSYERAHITRWLDAHNTCPATNQQLKSPRPQLVPNTNMKQVISEWAQLNNISLPPAPTYQQLDLDDNRPTGKDQGFRKGAPAVPLETVSPTSKPLSFKKGYCTRKQWAAILLLLVLLAGAGAGIGGYLVNKKAKQGAAAAAAAAAVTVASPLPEPAPPPPPAAPPGAPTANSSTSVHPNTSAHPALLATGPYGPRDIGSTPLFTDTSVAAAGGNITRITVFYGAWIDGLQVTFGSKVGALHGRKATYTAEALFKPGDRITAIAGCWSDNRTLAITLSGLDAAGDPLDPQRLGTGLDDCPGKFEALAPPGGWLAELQGTVYEPGEFISIQSLAPVWAVPGVKVAGTLAPKNAPTRPATILMCSQGTFVTRVQGLAGMIIATMGLTCSNSRIYTPTFGTPVSVDEYDWVCPEGFGPEIQGKDTPNGNAAPVQLSMRCKSDGQMTAPIGSTMYGSPYTTFMCSGRLVGVQIRGLDVVEQITFLCSG